MEKYEVYGTATVICFFIAVIGSLLAEYGPTTTGILMIVMGVLGCIGFSIGACVYYDEKN